MNTEKMESVLLVDEQDHIIGEMEKTAAHNKGMLHRAISVFIFNDQGELLLQKRAAGKYHSGGLWTNTCCTHPRLDESNSSAAARRLKEEMGLDASAEKAFDFIYTEPVNERMIENELDHVMIGYCNATPQPDADEVSDWKFVPLDIIEHDLKANGGNYTVWFRISFERVKDFMDIKA